MANKLDRAVNAVAGSLEGLVQADGSGILKAFKREVIDPVTEKNPPVLAMVISRTYRQGNVWIADCLLMGLARRGRDGVGENIIEMVAHVDHTIQALIDSGGGLASIDTPIFDMWYTAQRGSPLVKVGFMGGLRLRVTTPLLLE